MTDIEIIDFLENKINMMKNTIDQKILKRLMK